MQNEVKELKIIEDKENECIMRESDNFISSTQNLYEEYLLTSLLQNESASDNIKIKRDIF